jgi:hypothetical protein
MPASDSKKKKKGTINEEEG